MKPKTKLQKRCFKLYQKLKPISRKQEEWAEENCFYKFYVIVRNRHFCLECGHKWHEEKAALHNSCFDGECPSCGAKHLKRIHHWKPHRKIQESYAKICVVDGLQVVRRFHVTKYMNRQKPAEYVHEEISATFIMDNGRIESVRKNMQQSGFFGSYYDNYVYGDAEIRSHSRSFWGQLSDLPTKILPGRRTLPIIRRNGYKGYFHGKSPESFFRSILISQRAETLLKAGQEELFHRYVGIRGHRGIIDQYWPSIRIAMRHGFTIPGSDFFDHLELLEHYGKDILNPHYVCPDDFKAEHQRYVERRNRKLKEERLARKKEQIAAEEADYKERWHHYFDLSFSKDDIEIAPFISVAQFAEEGDMLHHCIYSSSYYKRSDSLMLSARVNGVVTETVEVDTERLAVRQSRGLQNNPSKYHDRILALVNENMDAIIACTNRRNIAEMNKQELQLTGT